MGDNDNFWPAVAIVIAMILFVTAWNNHEARSNRMECAEQTVLAPADYKCPIK